MKLVLIFTFILISFLSFSQINEYELSLIQQGKKIDIKTNLATIDKAPFQLVYKFKAPQSWGLIAGSNAIMQDAFSKGIGAMEKILQDAESGGADSYFNESKSIRAWDGKIQTSIFYEDDKHHSFDSIYKKGKWIFGVRTVSFLSTTEDNLMIEEWTDSILILATGRTALASTSTLATSISVLKLNLREIPNKSVYDVKGKYFLEEGEAKFQEGCEGCGNLGSFEFKKNGKEVKFLKSGSDNFSLGSYSQENYQVIIEDEKIVFTVSSDGNQLTDIKTGVVYTIVLQK
jgi:hypothetical protein